MASYRANLGYALDKLGIVLLGYTHDYISIHRRNNGSCLCYSRSRGL